MGTFNHLHFAFSSAAEVRKCLQHKAWVVSGAYFYHGMSDHTEYGDVDNMGRKSQLSKGRCNTVSHTFKKKNHSRS